METFLVGRLGNAQLKKKYKGAYVFKSFIYNNSLYVTNLPSWKTLHCIAVFDIKKKSHLLTFLISTFESI